MISIENLCFGYEADLIIDHLNLHVAEGESVALLGASGSGKSTLFRLIAGALRPRGGLIAVGGPISYMMQDDLLLSWRTVLGNVLLASELDQKTKSREAALAILEDVGLSQFAGHYPDELSGGMRQRVALARALLFKRPILLLDEPFAAVDRKKRGELYSLVRRLQEKYGLTIVFITHAKEDADALGARICHLDKGVLFEEEAVLC